MEAKKAVAKPKKAAVKKPANVQAQMIKLVHEILKGNGGWLCSYVWWKKGQGAPLKNDSQACYSSFCNHAGITEARIIVRKHDLILLDKKWAVPYWKWLVTESFYAKCFIGKDIRNGLKNGFRMDMNQPFMLVHGAAIGIRCAWEFPDNMKTWKFLVDKGVDKHIAHALTHILAHSNKDLFTVSELYGHALFRGSSVDPVKYRKQEHNKNAKLETKACESAGSYYGNFELFAGKGGVYVNSAFYNWLSVIPRTRVGMGNYIKMDDALIERIKKEEWNA